MGILEKNMICKRIGNFLLNGCSFYLHTVKWFQLLLFNISYSNYKLSLLNIDNKHLQKRALSNTPAYIEKILDYTHLKNIYKQLETVNIFLSFNLSIYAHTVTMALM